MQDIVFATANAGKMKEIRMILADLPVRVLSLQEAGISTEIIEDGATFEENALIKVRAIRPFTKALILADDSGLEVDHLQGAPGVYSARYMGENTPYSIKNQAIMDLLKGVPDAQRTARFVCAIAASFPDGSEKTIRATMEGEIARKEAGKGGFGYDPIFFLPDKGVTSAELPPEEKNAISHRGKALRQMEQEIRHWLDGGMAL